MNNCGAKDDRYIVFFSFRFFKLIFKRGRKQEILWMQCKHCGVIVFKIKIN